MLPPEEDKGQWRAQFMQRVEREITLWKGLLGLDEWSVRVGEPGEFRYQNCEKAYVLHDDTEYMATVHVDPDTEREALSSLVCHELLHLLMVDMQFAACTGASTETMDQYERAQERVINRLVDVFAKHP